MEKTKVGPFIPLPVAPTVVVGANVDGKPNYLAVGFVTGVNINPPILGVSLNRKHHTVKGLLENGTFSVNIPAAEHIRQTDYCGLVSGRSVDKAKLFSSFYGELETAPMINEFPIVCECRYTGQKMDFAMDTMFFGEIVQAYVNKELYKKGQPADILKIDPLLTGLDRQYRQVGPALGKSFSIGWEYLEKSQDSKNGKESRCALVNRSPKNILYIRCGVQGAETPKAIADILVYAKKQGADPIEGPFVRRNEGLEPEAGMTVGFCFKSPISGKGRIESGRMPGGRFAQCLHIGAYDKMSQSLKSIHDFICGSGFIGSGTVFEFYQNDPSLTPVGKLETMILVPVRFLKKSTF
jgi:flavin reductase (DIM6/NTAB) family NADH-FMN oxidoreductase RutF/effector-binding domain-containing protein